MKNSIANILAIAYLLTAALGVSAKLTPTNVRQFFIVPGQSATLTWEADDSTNSAYKITDYLGNVIDTGKAALGDGKASINIKLPVGYYRITFTGTKQTFGVDSIDPFQGKVDPFFAIDSDIANHIGPMSHRTHYKNFHAVRHDLIEILKRSGVSIARERLSWPAVNPAQDKFNFGTIHSYNKMHKNYGNSGVPVLDMFETAPKYVGRLTPKSHLPLNMIKMAGAFGHIADHWHRSWGALEVWNEPQYGKLPADQYVPLVKTLAYVMHHRKKPVLVGDASTGAKRYRNPAANNGLLDSIDFFNFHTYAWAPKMVKRVGNLRNWLVSRGHPAMPLWLTESGRPWTQGTDMPILKDGQVSALDITMKAVEAKACGVARYFAFLYTFFPAHQRFNYGMMGKASTPTRIFAAYAQAIRTLAHRPYLGDWPIKHIKSKRKIVRARVFGGKKNAVIVFYTGHVDKNAALHTSLRPLKIIGIDGRPLHGKQAGTIPIPDGLVYVVIDRNAVKPDNLKTNTTAMRLYKLAHGKRKKRSLSAIVLQTLVGRNKQIQPSVGGYWYRPGQNATQLTFAIRVNNLANQTKRVILKPTYHFDPAQTAAQPQQKTCQVEPHSFKQVVWKLTLPPQQHAATIKITTHAHTDNGASVSPVVFRLLPRLSVKQLLKRHTGAIRLPIGEINHWHHFWARGITGKMYSPNGKNWEFVAAYASSVRHRWAFPKFKWPKAINAADGYKGFVIRIRCIHPGTVRMLIWTRKNHGPLRKYWTRNKIIKADGQWHAIFLPFTKFSLFHNGTTAGRNGSKLDLSQIKSISLGMISGSDFSSNTLQVSDLWLVK